MATEHGPTNPIPAMATYEPLEEPVVVIGSQFLAQYPVHLTVTSSGGKDFKITDVNGTPIFQVKGKSFGIHGRRFLTDADGNNTLVSYKNELMTMHHRMEVFRGESQDEEHLLFRTKKPKKFQSNLDIYRAKNTVEEAPDFKIKGSREEGSFTINLVHGESNTIIAKMQRNFMGNFFLTAYPSVDYAFVAALVVLVFLHEIKAESLKAMGRAIASISEELIGDLVGPGVSGGSS